MRVYLSDNSSVKIRAVQRNGKFLCSSRDPIKEAKAWLQSYAKELSAHQKIIVLGCGAGYHLAEILNLYPDMIIEVIEFESNLFTDLQQIDSRFKNLQQIGLVSPDSASKNQLVLEFKPSWVGFENEYQAASNLLLDSHKGDIKTIVQNLQIKDQSVNAKIWRALREMVI